MAKGARFMALFKEDLPKAREGERKKGKEQRTTEHTFRVNMRSGTYHEGRLILEDLSVDGLVGVMESDNKAPTYIDPDLIESACRRAS